MKVVLLGHMFYQKQESLVDQAWWQIFIVILTAFSVSFLGYFFSVRSNKKTQLTLSKANLSRHAYRLDQTLASYLESLLNSYYYMTAVNHTIKEDQGRQFELMKMEGARSPELALEISRIHGEMIEEFSVIQQLAGINSTKRLENAFNELVYFEGYNIPRPDNTTTQKQANDYAKKNLLFIEENSKKLQKKIVKLNKELQKINVDWKFTKIRNRQ